MNTIDIEAATARSIAVCNMPGTNSQAVAEMTLGLMLAVLRKLNVFDGQLRETGQWRSPPGWQGNLGEIKGRTIGLVGFGAVPMNFSPNIERDGCTSALLLSFVETRPTLPTGSKSRTVG